MRSNIWFFVLAVWTLLVLFIDDETFHIIWFSITSIGIGYYYKGVIMDVIKNGVEE